MKYDLVIHSKSLVSPTTNLWIERENAIICVLDGKIEKISTASKNWKAKFKAKKYLDLSNHLVLPGLINAHTHLSMSLFRGLAEDMEFNQWLNEYILPLEKGFVDRNFVKVGAELAAWECIQQGVTCVNDMYYYTDVVLDVLDKAGLRGFVCQTFMSFPTPDNKLQNGNDFAILEKNIKKFGPSSRVRPAVGPHAPYTCNDDLLKKVRSLANSHDIPLHIHVSETADEVADSRRQFNKTPVQRLFDLGVMNGRTSFAHGIHLDEIDLDLIQRAGCGIAHNPESNMKIKAGVCKVDQILSRRIALGLGTDGAASNNNLNMIQEMDVGAKLQKLQGNKITTKDILKMATLGSAQCLGLDHLVGSIEEGKRADLIALSLDFPHMMPLHDPVAQVVYSANGSEVTHVICEGRVLMDNRKMRTLDTTRIAKDVERHHKKLKAFLLKQ